MGADAKQTPDTAFCAGTCVSAPAPVPAGALRWAAVESKGVRFGNPDRSCTGGSAAAVVEVVVVYSGPGDVGHGRVLSSSRKVC